MALLVGQRWVLGTWQAEKVGITRRRIEREVAQGMWQRPTPRTVLTLPINPAPEHLRMAAVLELGPHAVLGGIGSLMESGWTGEDAGHTDIIVPRRANLSGRSIPRWIRPRYAIAGSTLVDPVPRTSPQHAVIDAASWARSDREAAFLILSTVQQRITTVDALTDALDKRRRISRLALIRDVVCEARAGISSIPEREFARACADRHLPPPRRQTRRKDARGRLRYTDAEFDLPDGRMLIVEIDGAGHLDAEKSGADTVRNSALARATGAHVIAVTSFVLQHDPDPFFAELSAWFALATHGAAA